MTGQAEGGRAVVVKICGLRSVEAVAAAAEAGAEWVGLVFAPSKRQVTLAEAQALTGADYRRRPRFVGVFVDAEPAEVAHVATAGRLDLVQLSGRESPEYCAALRLPYLKVVHIGPETGADEVVRVASAYRDAEAIILDRAGTPGSSTAWGGTGTTIDAALAAEVVRRLPQPVVLAGGLRPETVGAALRLVQPWGVDVSSGVETDGVKDHAKIAAFVAAARSV